MSSNMNDPIEKAHLLRKITALETELGIDHVDYAHCSMKDVQLRFEYLNNSKEYRNHTENVKKDIEQAKRGLNLFVECMSFMADSVVGVDMSDWQKDMWWSLNKTDAYDEVLEELCIKYGGLPKMSPEARLATMLLMSFGSNILLKNAQAKMERMRAAATSKAASGDKPQDKPQDKPREPNVPDLAKEFLNDPNMSTANHDLTEMVQKLAEIRKAVADDTSSEASSTSSTWDIHDNAQNTPNDAK